MSLSKNLKILRKKEDGPKPSLLSMQHKKG